MPKRYKKSTSTKLWHRKHRLFVDSTGEKQRDKHVLFTGKNYEGCQIATCNVFGKVWNGIRTLNNDVGCAYNNYDIPFTMPRRSIRRELHGTYLDQCLFNFAHTYSGETIYIEKKRHLYYIYAELDPRSANKYSSRQDLDSDYHVVGVVQMLKRVYK